MKRLLTKEEKQGYLNAITTSIWGKSYSDMSLKERICLDTNLLARHLDGELTKTEFKQLKEENE